VDACGHCARKIGIMIKVFAACKPNETATDGYYSSDALNFDDDSSLIWSYTRKTLNNTQTTFGFDFTRITCLQLEGPEAPCRFSNIPSYCQWKWRDFTQSDYRLTPGGCIYMVTGKNRGRDAWHYVLVQLEKVDDFLVQLKSGRVDVTDYGYIIVSGWGKDAPEDIKYAILWYGPK